MLLIVDTSVDLQHPARDRRLAQRVPVRVHLVEVPDDIELRVGTTASVLVMKGSRDLKGKVRLTPAPRALQ